MATNTTNKGIAEKMEADPPSISIPRKLKNITSTISEDDIYTLSQYVYAVSAGMRTKTVYEIRNKVHNEILPKFIGDKILTSEEKSALLAKIDYMFGLDTQAPLWESVSNKYAALTIEFCKQLIEEYDCKAASEKALAQVVANAFGRIMEFSNTLGKCRDLEYARNEVNGYYSIISKELDRANRHFASALAMLRQIKAPLLKINVTAKTAFIAKNQQLNVNQDNNDNNENIEPK